MAKISKYLKFSGLANVRVEDKRWFSLPRFLRFGRSRYGEGAAILSSVSRDRMADHGAVATSRPSRTKQTLLY